jgi:spore coat protein U-like protein
MLAASALTATPAVAGGRATAALRVAATVVNSCTVQAQPMSFGTQPIITFATLDTTATILVKCGANTAFTVAIDNGTNFTTARRVHNVGWNAYMPYLVHSDAARTQVWGGAAGTTVAGNTGASGLSTLTAYGRITSPGIVFPGAYTDSVTVTVNF